MLLLIYTFIFLKSNINLLSGLKNFVNKEIIKLIYLLRI